MRRLLLALPFVPFAFAQVDYQLTVYGPGNIPGTIIPGSPACIVAYYGNNHLATFGATEVSIGIGGIGAPFVNGPPNCSATVNVPPNLPLGTVAVEVVVNGGAGATNVTVADFWILTSNGGVGKALAQNVVAGAVQTNNLTHPAHPGDTVTLYGAGLSSATQFEVLLGGHAAPVTYAGPAPSLPGIDQINFEVPTDVAIPNGCFVAVQVVVNGFPSNLASISKAAIGSTACTPPIDLTAAQLSQLDAGQTVPLASFLIDGLVSVPPVIETITTAPFETSGFVRNESFNVQTIVTNEGSLATLSQPLLAEDAYYSCTTSAGPFAAILAGTGGIDLGPKLTLTGPGTTGYILTPPNQAFESLTLPTGPPVTNPAHLPPPYFVPGVWQISGSGASQNPFFEAQYPTLPFSAQITSPPTLAVANFASLQSINPQNGAVVAWNPAGYGPGDVVTVTVGGPVQGSGQGGVVGSGANPIPIGQATISCRAHATDGQLSIPPSLAQSAVPCAPPPPGTTGYPVQCPTGYFQISLTQRPDQIVRADIPLSSGGSIPGTLTYSFTESFPITIGNPNP